MRQTFIIAICLCLLLCLFPEVAMASNNSRSYAFTLALDGKQEITAHPGQIISVTLSLKRTDSDQPADMHAVQAELSYDDAFLELIEGSIMTFPDVEWTDMARRTGGRVFYLNFLSLTGGEKWNSDVQMGSFQMRVLSPSGATVIRSQNCLVSVPDGSGNFTSVSNDAKVVVSTDCTVTFESGGGSEVPSQVVQYGEKIIEPQEPTRDGHTFNGWYADLDKTDLWDFDSDTVQGNMTLYAGWLKDTTPVPSEPDIGSIPVIPILICLLIVLVLLILAWIRRNKKRD